ncbi:sulfite exporter TauE/SafE family protein [Nordella sp. HKS 07]|uniref:sulfite exporter TauE/SafE family protein n=1 Tax=Nordella sp. HKS 07 TaxID=2712222 RepID=UPI0013E1093E|nr:sulfite exporter TauE/SafE family protein [Nordella sp. HKS 07]QIG47357.1 sulfite exporter TauE/SafE family protein [Nordella sp. HKS 07]
MLASPDLAHILIYAAALLFTGALGGFVAGLLGVGGGIVIVPVLFYIFTLLGIDEDVKMHLAVGTSLSTIIFTSAMSVRSHWRRGAVDRDMLKRWGIAIFAGVVAGTLLAAQVKGPVLMAVFGAVALLVSLHMAFSKPSWRLADKLPGGVIEQAMASGIGAVSAMMGIGGGTLSVPTLSLFGYPIHKAVGTAAAIGFIIGVPGTIGFVLSGLGESDLPPFSFGYVSLIGLALITPTSILMAPVGAWAAHALPVRGLKLAFAAFLFVTGLRMLWTVFG